MTARYGQLSYTSFDASGSAGGWRVKQTGGDLDEAEEALLVAGVHTVLNPVKPLPAFPTAAQLQRIPHRLAYRRINRNTACYWHTVPAGSDHTGRPGNVFVHAMLDREAGKAQGSYRPIELWRSQRWLCPYGGAAVAGAELPAEPPGPGDTVTRRSVVNFAYDTSTWRLTTLFGLMDAVAAAIEGGPPVVLGAESDETAAQWIGLISFLMSPGTARSLNFSTFDRADQLEHAVRIGQHLTAIPRDDLPMAPAAAVTIDETDTLSLGEFGGQPHRTAAAQPIEVTAWSAMAQVAMLDPDSMRLVLNDIDMFAAGVNDCGLHPAWPMAMSIATRERFVDAADEARSVITQHSPSSPVIDPAIVQTISDVVRSSAGTGTAEALEAARRMPDGLTAQIADALYLSRAICDDRWLDRPGPIPLGRTGYHGRAVPAELLEAIPSALRAAGDRGPDRVLRVADILFRVGIDYDLSRVFQEHVLPALRDPRQARRLMLGLGGRISIDCRLAVASVMMAQGEPPDHFAAQLDDAVLDWLSDGVTAPSAEQLTEARRWDQNWTRAAVRAARTHRLGPETDRDRQAETWWRRINGLPSAKPDQTEDRTLERRPATRELIADLVGAADSPEMFELAARVVTENRDELGVACAVVRLYEPQDWVARGYVMTYQRAYTPRWDEAVEAVGPDRVHHDFARRLLVLAVVGAIFGTPCPRVCAGLLTDPSLQTEVTEQVFALAETNVISAKAALAVSLLHPAGTDPIEPLLRRLAARIAATFPWDADEVNDVVHVMGQISAATDAASLRCFREMVLDALHGQSNDLDPMAAPSQWSH
ncbi:GAP1-N2 domain-containing protein [Mycobacterium kansasii]|uniref:Uncharacterized protein n=3 Tax=Mycobacterium kansasii TaxID=1768 RepID=A0A1V3XEL9_MYCKA|nr:hypothetical protein [Mycobacterium kansasii]AGZ53833.1 hypothetical protein MKAN_28690 [Mycobacterium kansasii ATCC 12478]ARG54585.1 hypothetical protein B1T43_00420 [Mycobacterium kansasii]ARG60032.1 hypothetical protein B1T45_00445 [Mycobacterium kansasii]ARG67776.1 hypothetical protein B1T47_00580 [Mycobacterium kansasii]ARG77718.1 hypothetical protein B1T51_28285 [Mycobacterium kansasii]